MARRDELPHNREVDDMGEAESTEPNEAVDKTESPGNAQGVPVPNEHAAPGTSEQFKAVDGGNTVPGTAAEQDRDELPAAGDHLDYSK
jgi:hypothetical protein